MTICVVSRSLNNSLPALAIARALAGAGHRVQLLIAPLADSPGAADDPDASLAADGSMVLHRLAPPPRWFGNLGKRWARRLAISRAIRRLGPQVVHLAVEDDRGIAVPPGTVLLQSVAEGRRLARGADAAVTPDGRFLDRSGLPMVCPGVPPLPSASPVVDGLDPDASAAQWRVLTYLAAVDQLRRSRRVVRLDRPHPAPSPASVRASGRSSRPTRVGFAVR